MAGGIISGSDPDQPLAEINVTPLVDVMLVLLVIFIIAAPIMAKALKVDLPKVTAPTDVEKIVVDLVIFADGRLQLDGEEFLLEQLPDELKIKFKQKPDAVLRLGGDGETPYKKIAQLLAVAQQSGIQRIAFATAPLKE
ncbi:MAG: biopolymer transporter ExbD [Magnetococcales bacterium]|nr:biopolymer transporter ExbD [Magnetococcales bacterium]